MTATTEEHSVSYTNALECLSLKGAVFVTAHLTLNRVEYDAKCLIIPGTPGKVIANRVTRAQTDGFRQARYATRRRVEKVILADLQRMSLARREKRQAL